MMYDSYSSSVYQEMAWDALKKCAKNHTDIEDLSLFNKLIQQIKNKESFHIARYNDGEWVFMLQIEPYFSRFIQAHGHNQKEVLVIANKLNSIIHSKPDYYIGVDSDTRALQGYVSEVPEQMLEKFDHIKNMVYGDIFNAGTIKLGINALIKPLKERCTITVGPKYLRDLSFSRHHVSIPANNCWNQVVNIGEQTKALIKEHLNESPVIVYACSLLSKWLVDAFYHKYGDSITQIDVGSCLDPWCAVNTRPWHKYIVRYCLNGNYIRKNYDYNGQGYEGWGYRDQGYLGKGYSETANG